MFLRFDCPPRPDFRRRVASHHARDPFAYSSTPISTPDRCLSSLCNSFDFEPWVKVIYRWLGLPLGEKSPQNVCRLHRASGVRGRLRGGRKTAFRAVQFAPRSRVRYWRTDETRTLTGADSGPKPPELPGRGNYTQKRQGDCAAGTCTRQTRPEKFRGEWNYTIPLRT